MQACRPRTGHAGRTHFPDFLALAAAQSDSGHAQRAAATAFDALVAANPENAQLLFRQCVVCWQQDEREDEALTPN